MQSIIAGSQMLKIVLHPSSFAGIVWSFKKVETLTRPNCLCFKMEQGMSRTVIWKLFKDIRFSTKQVVGIIDKNAN